MMTQEAKQFHARYETLSVEERNHIDQAYTAARKWLSGITVPANDDRAEEFVAAITKYYLASDNAL